MCVLRLIVGLKFLFIFYFNYSQSVWSNDSSFERNGEVLVLSASPILQECNNKKRKPSTVFDNPNIKVPCLPSLDPSNGMYEEYFEVEEKAKDITQDKQKRVEAINTLPVVKAQLPVTIRKQRTNMFDMAKATQAIRPRQPQQESILDKAPTAKEEDESGSRKWVKFFHNKGEKQADKEIHEWHKKSAEIIISLVNINRRLNTKDQFGSPYTNIALVRYKVVFKGNREPDVFPLPYFYMSSWPSSKFRIIEAFQKEKVKEIEQDEYKQYGLRFLTKSYKDGEEQMPSERESNSKEWFKKHLENIFNNENKNHLLGRNRINYNLAQIRNDKFPLAYYHSEQAILLDIKDKLVNMKRSFLSPTIDYVIVDISSRWDMCLGCGDSLFSASHTNWLNNQVFFRFSGSNEYRSSKLPYSGTTLLRQQKKFFNGYSSGAAYQGNITVQKDYKPYIAHTSVGKGGDIQ